MDHLIKNADIAMYNVKGQGKNGYRLNYIRARRRDTSEAWINSIFLVMNLLVLVRELYVDLLIFTKNSSYLLFQGFL